MVGAHKVWVSLPREFVDPTVKDDAARIKNQKTKTAPAGAKPPPDMAPILKAYGSLDKSPLKVEVKGGAPIDLTLD